MANKSTDYSLTELKSAFELCGKFAEDANYFVRTLESVSQKDRDNAAFYNALFERLKNKINEKLHEVYEDLQ